MILEFARTIVILRFDVGDIEVFEFGGLFFRVFLFVGLKGQCQHLDLALLTDDEGQPVTSENLLPNLLSEYGKADFTVIESNIAGFEDGFEFEEE